MGEYARRKCDNVEIKIGVCEAMYYLRYEDRDKVKQLPSSINPAGEMNLLWRIPTFEEDQTKPGDYKDKTGIPLRKISSDGTIEQYNDSRLGEIPGTIQATAADGLMVIVKCFHGEKTPEKGGDVINITWNGKYTGYELKYLKNTEDGIKPVIGCKHCGSSIVLNSWDGIWPYLTSEYQKRFSIYKESLKEAA